MAKFYLRTDKTSGTASLYVDVNRPAFGIRWRVNSGIKVDVAAWNKAQCSAKALAKYYGTDEGKSVQEKTALVEGIIKDFFQGRKSVLKEDKSELEIELNECVNLDAVKTKEEVQKRKEAAAKAKLEAEKNRLCQIWEYYEYFFEGIKDGSVLHGKQERYSKSSISSWTTFGKHLGGFLESKNKCAMTFDDIDRRTSASFVTYLKGRDLMEATIVQQVNHFRKLCNIAAEDGVNHNAASLRVWKSHEQKDEEKRAEIVLSDFEVESLYSLKLNGHVEQCRDLWILGYFSGQRVSDYSAMTRENFAVNEDGVPVIILRQQKTGTEVQVPIVDERVFEICEKYHYNFPKLKRDAINRGIKAACKMLAETVPTLNSWEVTLLAGKERDKEKWYIETRKRVESGEKLHGEESKRYKRCVEYATEHESGDLLYRRDYQGRVIRRRWELVGCHTSRRSLITSLHKSGLLTDREIMSVSGHSTLKSYETYLKVKTTERASAIYEKIKKKKKKKIKKEA